MIRRVTNRAREFCTEVSRELAVLVSTESIAYDTRPTFILPTDV